ncbi:carboxyltransferase domain-containing protein, partial [Acinetobacter baumannii]|nr:carboxyltransferase domain-containing protein [Acinetobacter baumannii]
MRFLSVNADCFLIELASLEETLALYNKLQNTQLNGIKDLVPAAKTILVFFNEIETNFKTLVASIQSLKIDSGFERSGQEVIVPICY